MRPRLIEADVHLYAGRLEVRHLKTLGGAGTQQVLLALALSNTASAAAVVSFSLAMQASVTVINALLGLAAAMAVCRSVRPVRAVRAALAGARA